LESCPPPLLPMRQIGPAASATLLIWAHAPTDQHHEVPILVAHAPGYDEAFAPLQAAGVKTGTPAVFTLVFVLVTPTADPLAQAAPQILPVAKKVDDEIPQILPRPDAVPQKIAQIAVHVVPIAPSLGRCGISTKVRPLWLSCS
jgi:hypothetical protein